MRDDAGLRGGEPAGVGRGRGARAVAARAGATLGGMFARRGRRRRGAARRREHVARARPGVASRAERRRGVRVRWGIDLDDERRVRSHRAPAGDSSGGGGGDGREDVHERGEDGFIGRHAREN